MGIINIDIKRLKTDYDYYMDVRTVLTALYNSPDSELSQSALSAWIQVNNIVNSKNSPNYGV
jgi:hypothetical protein